MVETRSLNAGVVAPVTHTPGRSGLSRVSHLVVSTLTVCAVLVLGACSTKPTQGDSEAKELSGKAEPLLESMSRAQAAEAMEGGRERARLIYRDAAKSYPTDKRPWLRLAQSYFDVADYGNAVLAAQEVVQRDPADSVAQGLLAVSGLRISTTALSALRNQNNLTTSARSEAEDMARNLRTILGEAVLVPKPADAAQEIASPRSPPRRVPARPRVVRSAPAVPPSLTVAPPVTTPPPASSNPFGALK